MFDTNEFWYKPFRKTLEQAETAEREEQFRDSLVIFINVEKEDELQNEKTIKKAVDNICWLDADAGSFLMRARTRISGLPSTSLIRESRSPAAS